jgi:glycosyltransferase involved in cell wall biosynthesis
MTPWLVSIVVPPYNYGRFVAEAVASALAQGYPHCEIIVVDDGSTDDTREILAPYCDRIRYIYQANQGLSAARNTGIRAAEGEFIALLDSDDVWHPRKLELQMHFLRGLPEVGLLATDVFMDQRPAWPIVDPSTAAPVRIALEDVIGRPRFAPSSVVIRKKCLDAAGLFDPTLRCVEDRDMWIRLASQCGLAKLPLPLLWFRLHPNSLSTRALQMEEAELRVLRKAFAETAALQGRWLLQRKVYSLAAFTSAQLFGANRQWDAALARLLSSFLLWPLPYRRDDAEISLIRFRVLIVLLLRALRMRAPDPGPGVTGTTSAPPLQGLPDAVRAVPETASGVPPLRLAVDGGVYRNTRTDSLT